MHTNLSRRLDIQDVELLHSNLVDCSAMPGLAAPVPPRGAVETRIVLSLSARWGIFLLLIFSGASAKIRFCIGRSVFATGVFWLGRVFVNR